MKRYALCGHMIDFLSHARIAELDDDDNNK